jgi:hypothetical protein
MAGTHAKAMRRADVLQRLSDRLGIDQADLYINARGDKEMALIITLERIADAVDEKVAMPEKKAKTAPKKAKEDADTDTPAVEDAKEDADAPLTVETVDAKPMVTTETVETVPAKENGNAQ